MLDWDDSERRLYRRLEWGSGSSSPGKEGKTKAGQDWEAESRKPGWAIGDDEANHGTDTARAHEKRASI